jgi:FKBP-type peptidyl-prolyl cis-trans isomerase FklB
MQVGLPSGGPILYFTGLVLKPGEICQTLGIRKNPGRKEIFMKAIVFSFFSLLLLSGASFAAEQVKLEDVNAKVNYSFGYQVGQKLKELELGFDQKLLLEGIQAALSGAEPLLSPQEMRGALTDARKRQYAAKQSKKKETARQHREEGSDFLTANAEKPGVVTLPSGVQYKVIRKGTGKTPGPSDKVTVHYRGTLINGQEFDSSYRKGEPASFRVNGVIKGWAEALQLMKEGARWQLFVPADLAYGERGPVGERAVIFDVELISVKSSG